MKITTVSILGCGNIGSSIALGLVKSGFNANNIILTRRRINQLHKYKSEDLQITDDNILAVEKSQIIILAVAPGQVVELLDEISSKVNNNHLIISIVSGLTIREIKSRLGNQNTIVRAMPNTAAILMESMTCIATDKPEKEGFSIAKKLFDRVGKTLIINENQMESATALCASGVAFFLRAIRAASQGGIEIGFHSDEAFNIASQTARGAATLLLDNSAHPESEIDRVTTPMGATIAGLNEMEHQGFSSALIKGITTSTEKVSQLFNKD